jgi:hypothetical protein
MVTRLLIATLVSSALLAVGSGAFAAGGQNANGNPTGDPAEDTYQNPFSNQGDGRMLIYCADDETLLILPAEGGAVEATCVPTE